jgi:hypothetical protein
MVRALALALLSIAAPDADAPRKAAIRKAVGYLDGALFALPEVSGTPRKPFTLAVAGLDYLMLGETRTGGPSPIARIRDELARHVTATAERTRDPAALPPAHGLASSEFVVQYTWVFAMAAWFLAELEPRGLATAESKRALATAVAALAEAQDPNGGWGHGRVAPGAKPSGYPSTLVSSTNVVAIALGLLDAAGRADAAGPAAKAREYLRAARLGNGSFPYDPSQRQSGFAETNAGRSAGSLFAWHCLGMPRDAAFRGSAEYVSGKFDLLAEGHGSPCLNVQHVALCCRMLGRTEWERFRKVYEPRILAKQREDGSLGCIREERAFGVTCDDRALPMAGLDATQRCYTTALHLFALLLDRDRLDLLRRRKPGAPVSGPK